MSWRWDIRKISEQAEPPDPSPWILLVMFILIEVAGVLLVISQWPAGKPTMSKDFFFQAFFMPIFVYLFVQGAVLHIGYEQPRDGVRWWNTMCQWRLYRWTTWTRSHVALVDSVVLTPEDELAERMLGLEGAAPVNPDKTLALEQDMPAGASRVEHVLEKLLTPLLPVMARLVKLGTLEVVLQTPREPDLLELQRVMRKLKLPEHLGSSWQSGSAVAPMDSLWVDAEPLSAARLVIACQLHDGEEQPAFTEMAVALLLAPADMLARARPVIKPQAYLYRAITAESEEVEPALAMLLGAEQLPAKRIKQFWFSRLDKLMRHAVTTAIKDAPLNVAMQDIDRALGKPDHANGWLAQALAGQMVRHGQGAQLVATPCKSGVAMNVVGPTPAPVAAPAEILLSPISAIWMVGATSLTAFVFLLGIFATFPLMPWWGYLLMWLALMLLQVVAGIAHRRLVSTDFDDRCFG